MVSRWRYVLAETTIMFEGVRVRIDPEAEIVPGDLYIAERNTGPKLLTCRKVFPVGEGGYIVPVESAYAYSICECRKVIKIEEGT